MPNRYIHAIWKLAYEQSMFDKAHPEEAQNRLMGEALVSEIM